MGKLHIQLLQETGLCEVTCVEVDKRVLADCAALFNLRRVFEKLSDVDGELYDGAIIATPTNTHLSAAMWCAERRVNFLVEKPIAVDCSGVAQLLEKQEESNIVAGVAYPRRYSAATQELYRRLMCGAIGDLKMVHTIFSQDYRAYRPDYARIYYSKIATGGGALTDALSHHIDLATFFAGPIETLSCFHDRLMFEDCEGEDCAIITARFRDGVLGSIQGNQFQKANVDQIELVGTLGNLRYERIEGVLYSNFSSSSGWEKESLCGDWHATLAAQTRAFLNAIDGGEPLLTSLREGLHTIKAVSAARRFQPGEAVDRPD